jgi:hypothetical protein
MKFSITAAAAAALAVNALAVAGAAAAVTFSGSSAAETVKSLQDQGYAVRINGSTTVPLSRCTVTGVNGLSNSNVDVAGKPIDTTQFSTVFVDVDCPSH